MMTLLSRTLRVTTWLLFLSLFGPGRRALRAEQPEATKGELLALMNPETIRGNRAVFVGVNQFGKDQLKLDYAVNDAIALADVFIRQLRLIPAKGAVILLGGQPTAEFSRTLAELQALGVGRVLSTATKEGIEEAVTAAVRGLAEDGLLVVSISSHGAQTVEGDSSYFIVPQGEVPENPFRRLRVQDLDAVIDQKPLAKRVVFMDTCRTVIDGKGGEGSDPAGDAYLQAYKERLGKLVVMSCGKGQKSRENPDRRLGVFTGYLVDAFAGEADIGRTNFVTLHDIVRSADIAAKSRAAGYVPFSSSTGRADTQQVNYRGAGEILDLPVARSGLFERHQRRVTAARRLVADAFAGFEPDFQGTFPAVTDALRAWRGPEFEELLERIDTLLRQPTSSKVRDFARLFMSSARLNPSAPPSSPGRGREAGTVQPTERSQTGKPVLLLGAFGTPTGSLTPSRAAQFELVLLEAVRRQFSGVAPARLGGTDAFLDWNSEKAVRELMESQGASLAIHPVLVASGRQNNQANAERVVAFTVELSFQVFALEAGRLVSREFAATGTATEFADVSRRDGEIEALSKAVGSFLERTGELAAVSKVLSSSSALTK